MELFYAIMKLLFWITVMVLVIKAAVMFYSSDVQEDVMKIDRQLTVLWIAYVIAKVLFWISIIGAVVSITVFITIKFNLGSML